MNVVLNITDKCNLACDYCYYKNNPSFASMDEATIRTAIDFFVDLAKKRNDSLINLTIFGGEPLMEKPLIFYTEDYSKQQKDIDIRFAINTNATLLDEEFIKHLKEENYVIYLSLDGKQATHDKHRRLANKKGGSFEMILPYLNSLSTANTSIIKVITVETAGETYNAIEYFINKGFRQIAMMPDFNDNWTRESFDILIRDYRKIAKLYIKHQKRGQDLYINLIDDKIKMYISKKSCKETTCAMCENIFVVATNGNIFPCVRFVADGDDAPYIIGNINKGLYPKKLLEIQHFMQTDKPECKDCTIKDRCLGNSCGCISYSITGSLFGLSPLVCEHERAVIGIADKIGKELVG